MQGRPRRSFTEDCKRQCAELVVSSGRSITSVVGELGQRDSGLRRWIERFGPQPTTASGISLPA
jgi:transposase